MLGIVTSCVLPEAATAAVGEAALELGEAALEAGEACELGSVPASSCARAQVMRLRRHTLRRTKSRICTVRVGVSVGNPGLDYWC